MNISKNVTNSANSHSSSPSLSVAAPSLSASSAAPPVSLLPPSLHPAPSPNVVVDADATANVPGSPSSASGLATTDRHHVTQNTTGVCVCNFKTMGFGQLHMREKYFLSCNENSHGLA